jgi:cell division protein ZapA
LTARTCPERSQVNLGILVSRPVAEGLDSSADRRFIEKMGKERERLVEIKVFGQTYTVKTDAEEEHVKEIARYVNEKMEEVLKKTKSVSTMNVAILTALNIADDLLKEKEKRITLLREIEVKSKDLAEKIDTKICGKESEKVSITG